MRVPDVSGNQNNMGPPANIHGLTIIGVPTNVGTPVYISAQYLSGVTGIMVAAALSNVSSSR